MGNNISQGKTWLTSLYCVVRSICFAGSRIVIASGVKSQAIEVLNKIETDFLKNYGWGSQNLKNEISEISSSINNPHCYFKNGSYIKIVTSNDNARSNRANIIVRNCLVIWKHIVERAKEIGKAEMLIRVEGYV